MPNDVLGNLLVEQGALPAYTELTRSGISYSAMLSDAQTQAPLTAVPTTVAMMTLYNNTSGNAAMTMVIDQIFAFHLLGVVTVPSTGVLWAQVTTQRLAPAFTAVTIASNSGRPAIIPTTGGRVMTGVNVTTVVANGWRPYGNPQSHAVAAATPGEAWSYELNGRLIVPPGTALCLSVTTETISTNTYNVGASWTEVPLLQYVA